MCCCSYMSCHQLLHRSGDQDDPEGYGRQRLPRRGYPRAGRLSQPTCSPHVHPPIHPSPCHSSAVKELLPQPRAQDCHHGGRDRLPQCRQELRNQLSEASQGCPLAAPRQLDVFQSHPPCLQAASVSSQPGHTKKMQEVGWRVALMRTR